jgi:hypothetical protein
MSVTVPQDELIAELAYKLASQSMSADEHIVFPQIVKGVYHSLSSMVRDSHNNNYDGRHAELRDKEENFPESMFELEDSPFKRGDTSEEIGHFVGAATFYLSETLEGFEEGKENSLLKNLDALREYTLFALNERQIVVNPLSSSLDARDATRALSHEQTMFSTEYGLDLFTNRLLIENPHNGQYFRGEDVLVGLLAQGFKTDLSKQTLFIPRSFPYEDTHSDPDLSKLFSQVAKSGDKSKVPQSDTLLALNVLTSKVKALSEVLAKQPADKIAGLDGVMYNDKEKRNLVNAVKEMSNGLANVAISPLQTLNTRLPFTEAKDAYAAERVPSEKVYLYLPLEHAVGFELKDGNLTDALHSAYQNNQGVVTSDYEVANMLQSKRGGSVETFSVTPMELKEIPSNLHGPHAMTSAFIRQAAYSLSDDALRGDRNAIQDDIGAFGMPATDALLDAMVNGADEIYPSMDLVMKQQVMGIYATARLKPSDRKQFEDVLLNNSNADFASIKNK